ncbi:MAG: hypothetical protein HQL45_01405 [Alphaproteobacteria bacterium]|nr:hypothetical protein [Alphaproteobacteria bacterium]
MSWFKRTPLVVLLLLTGCGFHPLHGTGGQRSATVPELSAIKINTIADRTGQMVRNALLDRLTPTGEPQKPRYLLQVTMNESKQSLGILKDETSSRANFVLTASFALIDLKGQTLYSASTSSQASYNILNEHYASTASERNARDRTTTEVADAIYIQLSSYFSRLKSAGGKAP